MISMKKTIWVVFIFLSLVRTYAQDANEVPDNRPEYIISANIGGDASLLTIGFEKLFFIKPGLTLAGKVAFGYNQEFQLFSSEEADNFFILPHSFTFNLSGGKRSFGEIGIGGSWITSSTSNLYIVYPMLGYRYHPFKNPGFSFRAWVYYPFGQMSKVENIWISPFGVSFGIAL